MKPMVYIKPGKSWEVMHRDIDGPLLERLRSADIIVSDLDNTDAPSIGEHVFFDYLKRHAFDREVWDWLKTSVGMLGLAGKEAWPWCWDAFIKKFLDTPEEVERMQEKYTELFTFDSLYPGVTDFYDSFPDAVKVYISRAPTVVTAAYEDMIGFDTFFAQQIDKGYATEKVIEHFPERRTYIVKGDSRTDEHMLHTLQCAKKDGRIDDVVGIYVCKNKDCLNKKFDVNIGRDYQGLVQLLQTVQDI